MPRSIPIWRKVLVAFALPILTLGALAGAGVFDAERDRAMAEEALDSASGTLAIQNAFVAVGDERMVQSLSEVGALAEDSGGAVTEDSAEGAEQGFDELLAEAVLRTDSALDALAGNANVTTETVWTALSAARSTPVGRLDNYGRAAGLLLEQSEALTVETGSVEAQGAMADLAVINRFLESQDLAWLGFANRNSDDLRSTAGIIEAFAVGDRQWDALSTIGLLHPDGPIQRAVTATSVLDDLRSTAVEDMLNTEQMLVPAKTAILSHNDARSRWVVARNEQANLVVNDLVAGIGSAENRRNNFGIFGLFGLLILGCSAVVLYQSIIAPIAAAAAEAQTVVKGGLRESEGAADLLDSYQPRHLSASTDGEVGQFVEAINTIQDRLYGVAQSESLARQKLSGRTVTVAGRNASLLHELVRNVSAWRNSDGSPEVRQRLFKIDHIATRMQRNIEAGLVLGGGHSERRWTKPISAVNTARLALGEVTEFDRVDVSPMEDVRLHGLVAPDVAHLLAELIDNGLAASANLDAPRNRVGVEGAWVTAGWSFLVHDCGTGLDVTERDRINRSLHTPGLMSEGSTTALGFTLIARTAARFGIDVRLIERPTGGTSARIILPVELIDSETIPADRKRIDAGRGTVPMDGESRYTPATDAHHDVADAYFGDRPLETSPLEVSHDVNAEMKRLVDGEVPPPTHSEVSASTTS